MSEAAPGVFTFDQAFGIPGLGVGANIPIRMVVMRLDGGGTLLYNPCNPTAECLQMFADAGLEDVRYIVLGTVAIEHKWHGKPWSQRFPKAEVWISPRTFSWPIDFGPSIPVAGIPLDSVRKIPKDATLAPWHGKGVDHLQLTVDYAPRTVFEESIMYHRVSGTLVCTDLLVGMSNDPPEILRRSPYREGLLYFARDKASDSVDVNSEETLRDGYQKSTLLLQNINPRSLLSYAAGDLSFVDQVGAAFRAPQPELGYQGWYPCDWQAADSDCANLLRRSSAAVAKVPGCRPGWRGEWARLIAGAEGTGLQVPSFVAELQVSRDPEAVSSFAEEVERRWPGIKQVVPAHFTSPLPTDAGSVRRAIASAAKGPPMPLERTADLSAILNFRDYLEENALIYKPASGRGQWRPV